MPNFTPNQLRRAMTRLFEAAGVPGEVARHVSGSLVESNLMGHDSHGVQLVPRYLLLVKEGHVNPTAEIETVHETPTTVLLDAHRAFGQIAATKGMTIAVEKAREHQLAMVGIKRGGHIARLGEYTAMAAEHGFIGFASCNGGPSMAPYGGIKRITGNNPISFAVPTGQGDPFLLDFANSTRAVGKLMVAQDKEESVPAGWIQDKDGQPTTDPADFFDGGSLLPSGEYKGFALGLFLDILGGALTGHSCSPLPDFQGGNGTVLMAINIAAFGPIEQFQGTVQALFQAVKACPTAPGVSEILIPGEPESRAKELRLLEGIPVPEKTWERITEAAEELGVDVQQALDD
jgi:uncharacterized oxidoreductase